MNSALKIGSGDGPLKNGCRLLDIRGFGLRKIGYNLLLKGCVERMSPIKLNEILRPFEGKWVALDEAKTKVLASGDSPERVAHKAKEKSQGRPVITFVPAFDVDYVG